MMDSTPKTMKIARSTSPTAMSPGFMIFIAAYELSYVIPSQFAKGIDCVN